jgi:hypothetical protein
MYSVAWPRKTWARAELTHDSVVTGTTGAMREQGALRVTQCDDAYDA